MIARKFITVGVMILLMVSTPEAFSGGGDLAPPQNFSKQFSSYQLGIASPVLNYSIFYQATNGQMTIAAFKQFVVSSLIPNNVRLVFLDVGWSESTPSTSSPSGISYQSWIDQWLNVSSQYEIQNVITVPGLNRPSKWMSGVLKLFPGLISYDQSGNPLNIVSVDNPEVLQQLKVDLLRLFELYGKYSSWVGITPPDLNANGQYGSVGSSIANYGFSNYSIRNFVNSPLFRTSLSANGTYQGGEVSKLWSMFTSVENTIQLSSGVWMNSAATSITNTTAFGMEFVAPQTAAGFEMRWYGRKVGSPSNINLEFYEDNGQGVPSLGHPIGSTTEISSNVTVSDHWQGPIRFSTEIKRGISYWIVFRTANSDPSNFYSIYSRTYRIDSSRAVVFSDYPRESYSDTGAAIVWLTADGHDLLIYPYQHILQGGNYQSFVAPSTFSFNTVFIFLSDREYDEGNATLQVLRSSDGQVLASAILSQKLTHGLEWWVPFSLNKMVNLTQGQSYALHFAESGYSWQNILRVLVSDPARAGFQGQEKAWFFKLALMNLTSQHFDILEAGAGFGNDPINNSRLMAVRFKPPQNSTLNAIDVLTSSASGTKGSFRMSIVRDSGNAAPSNQVLFNASLPLGAALRGGWASFIDNQTASSRLNLSMKDYYWAVFSTSGDAVFRLDRLISPYKYLVLVSPDSGGSWGYPAEGPSEIAFRVNTTSGIFGMPVLSTPDTALSSSVWAAQPFVLNHTTYLKGVFLGELSRGSVYVENSLEITLRPDGYSNSPSVSVIAEGTYYATSVSKPSMDFVQFNSTVQILAGKRYWITIQPVSGSFGVSSIVYDALLGSPWGSNSSAKVTLDGGNTWTLLSGENSIIPFALAQPTRPPPTYNTGELAGEIATHESQSPQLLPLRGWNAYLQESYATMFRNLISRFTISTGKSIHFYTYSIPSVLQTIGVGNEFVLTSPYPPSDSRDALASEATGTLTRENSQFLPVVSVSNAHSNLTLFLQSGFSGGQMVLLADKDLNGLLSTLGQTLTGTNSLNRLMYPGSEYGNEAGLPRVLVISTGPPTLLPNYLSSIFRVTVANLTIDSNMSRFGGFEGYDSLIWLSTSDAIPIIPNSLASRIDAFVRNGGSLIITGPSPPEIENTVGMNFTGKSVSPAGSAQENSSSPIVAGVDVSQYMPVRTDLEIKPLSTNVTVVVHGLNSVPWVSTRTYGKGVSIYVALGLDFATGQAGECSAFVRLLTNSILFAAKDFSLIPPLVLSSTGACSYGGGGGYSVNGVARGPVLFWVTSGNSSRITIRPNPGFFNISAGKWIALNPNDWKVLGNGSNNSIRFNATLRPGWNPIYLLPNGGDFSVLYATESSVAGRTFTYQGVFNVTAPKDHPVWLALRSNFNSTSVQLNGISISQVNSIEAFNSSSKPSWYYDHNVGILYVAFKSVGFQELRIVRDFQVQATPSYLVPLGLFAVGVVVLVILEAGSLLMARRTRRAVGLRNPSSETPNV